RQRVAPPPSGASSRSPTGRRKSSTPKARRSAKTITRRSSATLDTEGRQTPMSTMNPEEIRRLPIRRDLLYNGLTREQVVAIGFDPDEVEAGRLAHNEWASQQRRDEDAQLALAAQQAVAEGEVTYAEAAQALLAAGRRDAHGAVVQMWREEESW